MSKEDSTKKLKSSAPNAAVSLRLDWCSHEAAKYAVEKWHYSRRMPTGKLVQIGVWEKDRFIGAVVFGRGANNNLCKAFRLRPIDICELVRVALTRHETPVSRIVSVAIGMLRKQSAGLKLIVSYADPVQGHVGSIYQAMGWIHDGQQQGQTEYLWNGKQRHGRSCTATRGTTVGLPKVQVPGKYRYLMPLDAEMRKRILPLAKPYPKRVRSETIDTLSVQEREGGETPTLTLQSVS